MVCEKRIFQGVLLTIGAENVSEVGFQTPKLDQVNTPNMMKLPS